MNLLTWIAQSTYWNWFRPYWLFIFCGFAIAIGIAWINFRRRHIPTQGLYVGVFILTPIALIGASFFGKFDVTRSLSFFTLFAFWEPGMSIHGGLIFGMLAGWIWFGFEAKKHNISIWVYGDMIIPNILLAQALGRWGNFFNHEILGAPVSKEELLWLPSFIRDSLFKWYVPADGSFPTQAFGIDGGAVDINSPQVQYFQPIFLYESFANVMLWFTIVLVVPFIFRYSYYYRFRKEEPEFGKLSFKGVWAKWYYDIKPDPMRVKNLTHQINLKKVYFKNRQKMTKGTIFKTYFKYWFSRIKQIFLANSQELEKIENPNQLQVLRCGVLTGLYIGGYNSIRLILEIQRPVNELFIKNLPALDYSIIGLIILLGIGLVIFAQWIAVKKWRKGGWLYEKQY